MKQIDFQQIIEGVRTARIPAETFEHIQQDYQEGLEALLKALNCDPNEITILSGSVVTENGQDYDLSSGWVAYQNEIFEVDAVPTFTAPGGETAVWVLQTSYIDEDPILYDDGSTHNTHPIRKLTIQAGLAGSGLKDWDDTKPILRFVENNGSVTLKIKMVEIGEWDMDANNSVNVAHGITDTSKIRSISALIINDDGTSVSDFQVPSVLGGFELAGGITSNSIGEIILSRLDGCFFDSLAYNQTAGYNRGWIKIEYVE